MKILFLIDSLSGGGAERAMTRVANGLVEKTNHEITICQLFRSERDFFVDERVDVVDLSKKRLRVSIFFILKDLFTSFSLFLFEGKSFYETFKFLCQLSSSSLKLKDYIETNRPDVALSFLINSCVSLLYNKKYLKLKIPIICAIRNKFNEELDRLEYRRFYNDQVSSLFPCLDYYLAVTAEEIDQVTTRFNIPKKNCYLIGNGVDIASITSQSEQELGKGLPHQLLENKCFKIATAGRLEEVKNHKFLIETLAILKKENVSLYVIGEGGEIDNLTIQAEQCDLSNRVFFLGWQKNPFPIICKCDLFVLPSRWEGFPNILLESMVLGIPVASTRSSQAVIDLLDGGEAGFLIDTPEELAQKIRLLSENTRICEYYATMAYKKGGAQTINSVVDLYVDMFNEVSSYERK